MNPAASPTNRLYHVWFSTKGRLPALDGEIGATVKRLFFDVATRKSIAIVEVEVAFDHVHILVAIEPPQTLSRAMHDLKGVTAREVFKAYPELRLDMHSNSFWQKSFGWRPVPDDEVEVVRRYIRTQLERPIRHT